MRRKDELMEEEKDQEMERGRGNIELGVEKMDEGVRKLKMIKI